MMFGKQRRVDPATAPPAPEPGTPFTGAGACFREGFYYPLVNDEHGNEAGPNLDSPLVWLTVEGHPQGGYLVHAAASDPNHFHTYGMNTVEVTPAPIEEES
jgi:hypothetical protein